MSSNKVIYTIGHSTRSLEDFIQCLRSFDVAAVIDVRLTPFSRRYPHFNKEFLADSLLAAGISYFHITALGGRRKPLPDSENVNWRNGAFRGYADHMQTEEFKIAFDELEKLASKQSTVMMCSEAVWWSCHRALIADLLKNRNWTVNHITAPGKAKEHPYTSAAAFKHGQLVYHPPDLFKNG